MRTREQIEQEITELLAKQAAAPHWGAAVGARHERLSGLYRELQQLTSTHRPEENNGR